MSTPSWPEAAVQGHERATALHQRAWLLQLAALELHTADAAVPQHREALEELLATLLLPQDAGALCTRAPMLGLANHGSSYTMHASTGADGERRGGCMAGLLESAVYPIDQPQLSHEAGSDVCRLQQVRSCAISAFVVSGADCHVPLHACCADAREGGWD